MKNLAEQQPSQHTIYARKWRAENKESVAISRRAYRLKNKDKILSYAKAYKKKHKDKVDQDSPIDALIDLIIWTRKEIDHGPLLKTS